MFDDHTCMAFFLFFLSFFLSFFNKQNDADMCIFPFPILSFFVAQMLNYGI